MNRKLLLGAIVAVGFLAASFAAFKEAEHVWTYGHIPPLGLHSDLSVQIADLGIPGITKVYEAHLYNFSLFPFRIEQCDFIDDTMSHGTMVAYAVEKRESGQGSWTTVVELSGDEFCKPYPLGILQAGHRKRLLWFGQSISTGWEATEARDALKQGDSVRFVVFTNLNGTKSLESRSLPTAPFVVTERVQSKTEFRLRH